MKWYDKGRLLSYNKILNFLIGNRGGGKTYAFKEWCIRDFLKNKKQFVWVRRYKTEGLDFKDKFFSDIQEKYPNVKLVYKQKKKGGEFIINGETAGFFIPLSIQSSFKSNAYPNVNKIIFDEFLIDKDVYHYLPNEPTKFLGLMETVFRLREEKGAFLIANNITHANPYFMYFNIPIFKGRFYITDSIAVEMYTNEIYIEEKKQTRFGKLIDGTPYGDYVIENKSLKDNDIFIKPKSKDSKFLCAIKYKNQVYGFWMDSKQAEIYCNNKFDKQSSNIYALTKDDHNLNTFLISSMNDTYIKFIVRAFKLSQLYFDNPVIKAGAFEMLSYFVR